MFSMNAHEGTINWASSPSPSPATANESSPILDSGGLYVLDDAVQHELFGQSAMNGNRTLYTPLFYYDDANDPPLNQFLVVGKRVYYQTQNNIICITR